MMEGGLVMDNNDLLKEIIDGIDDGYDMEGSLASWIDEDIFELFDEFLSKGIILSDDEKKELLNKMVSNNSEFFNDKINILFLKLMNLYNKNQRVNGENQDLYYLVERFLPVQADLSKVSKQIQELVNIDFRSYIENNFSYESVLNPYVDAKNQSKSNLDDETLAEASNILGDVLERYNDDYVYGMIEDNRKEDFEELVSRFNINMLAEVYCDVNGNEFTIEERNILSNELSQMDKSTLFSTISGKKK